MCKGCAWDGGRDGDGVRRDGGRDGVCKGWGRLGMGCAWDVACKGWGVQGMGCAGDGEC